VHCNHPPTYVVCPLAHYITPISQIRAYNAEIFFELLNSHDQDFTLNHLVKTLQQNALEEAMEPEPEPNKRTMTVKKGARTH